MALFFVAVALPGMADELTATDRLYLPKLKALLTVWLKTQRDIVRGGPACASGVLGPFGFGVKLGALKIGEKLPKP